MGLFAAIPAVIAYNRFSDDINRIATRFESFMEEFSNILQRQARWTSHGSNRRGGRRLMNEINVVPYIDVMLVLLVIFMVTAPLINPGQVELPQWARPPTRRWQPLEVSVRTDQSLWVRDRATQATSARSRATSWSRSSADSRRRTRTRRS